MTDSKSFPLELLNRSKEVRLSYFKSCFIAHPAISSAKESFKRVAKHPGQSFVVFVYGPTGAGKTTLRQLIKKEIIDETLALLEDDRGCIPIAEVEAVLQQSGLFNPKDHLKRSLAALNEPKNLIDCKIDYGVRGISHNEKGEIKIEPTILETELGWALEKALKYRHPKAFLIDEAHHMLMLASGKKLSELPEAIKSLANRTEVVHGLLGTYDLLVLHNVGDQLSRRSVYVHFPRYHAICENDRNIFQSIIWSLCLEMPLLEQPDFLDDWEYIYSRTLGCVGTLKNWFNNALADALEEGENTLTLRHLEARSLSIAQCRNILAKIKDGEKKHAEVEGNLKELLQDLGLEDTSIEQQEAEVTPQQDPKTDVGMPNPKRRPVGE
jgi:hypothetical protein